MSPLIPLKRAASHGSQGQRQQGNGTELEDVLPHRSVEGDAGYHRTAEHGGDGQAEAYGEIENQGAQHSCEETAEGPPVARAESAAAAKRPAAISTMGSTTLRICERIIDRAGVASGCSPFR